MSTVAITLSDDLQLFVHSMVESGRFNGPNELVTDAIYALKDQFELERLKLSRLQADIRLGLEDIEHGLTTEQWDLADFLKERHRVHALT